jgi:hypothetical protein
MRERARVSLVVVNYRTPLQTRLCLRSLRRYTEPSVEVVVVDNGSADASLTYLRGLRWIRLVENTVGPPTHERALDLGVAAAAGDVIGVLHSDTYVRRADWLETLLGWLRPADVLLGSPDRLIVPLGPLGRFRLRHKRRKLARQWRESGLAPKLVTHCALYRRALFDEHGQRFEHPRSQEGRYVDCGEPIQRYCEERGLGMRVVGWAELAPLLWHFEGATLNAVGGRRLGWKRRLRAWRFFRRREVRAILGDDSLDA